MAKPYNQVRDICFYIVVAYLWKVSFSGFKCGVKKTVWKKKRKLILNYKMEEELAVRIVFFDLMG